MSETNGKDETSPPAEVITPGQEIAPTETKLLDLMSIGDIEQLERESEKRLKLLTKMTEVSLKATKARHWTHWGKGHYRITEAGAEKIRQLWGISIVNPVLSEEHRHDEDGDYYVWTASGTIQKGDTKLECIGTCSSRDKFFGWDSYAGEKKANGKHVGEWRPLKDVNVQNVKKKAYTNFLVNAIQRFMGLQDVSAEELEAAGIPVGDVEGVSFKSGSEGGGSRSKRASTTRSASKLPAEELKEWEAFLADAILTVAEKEKYAPATDVGYQRNRLIWWKEERPKRAKGEQPTEAKAETTKKPAPGATTIPVKRAEIETLLTSATTQEYQTPKEVLLSMTDGRVGKVEKLSDADVLHVYAELTKVKGKL